MIRYSFLFMFMIFWISNKLIDIKA
jgi:hypothetical protein